MSDYPRVNLSNTEKRKLVEKLTLEQDNKCYICGETFGNAVINGLPYKRLKFLDHNHKTGVPRKLLCNACNSTLANFETYADTRLIIEHKKRMLTPRMQELKEQLTDLEKEIENTEALKIYIETGECTLHLLHGAGWPKNENVRLRYPCVDASKQLNDLAYTSTENYHFILEYLRQSEATAVKECIKLLGEGMTL
jgi:hypothetical protein